MKVQIIATLGLAAFFFVSCNSKEQAEKDASANPTPQEILAKSPATHGKLSKPVELTNPLNQEWIKNGQGIYDMKCLACHKLDETRIVGPGWKGVTERREPVWIMNMIVNVDEMLDNDPDAQELLEQCLVRMPNQNLTEDDARHVLEFMRSNDGAE